MKEMAGTTRLELATSAVTGQRSNQLNYVPAVPNAEWWAVQGSNLRPPACKEAEVKPLNGFAGVA